MTRTGATRNRVLLEPGGLQRAPRAPRIFTPERQRNLDQPGIANEVPAAPDNVLIATLVSLGCPRWFADQVRWQPPIRFSAMAVYMLVLDAREGKHVTNARTGEITPARDLVDAIRAQYADARRDELISDIPAHTIGFGDR